MTSMPPRLIAALAAALSALLLAGCTGRADEAGERPRTVAQPSDDVVSDEPTGPTDEAEPTPGAPTEDESAGEATAGSTPTPEPSDTLPPDDLLPLVPGPGDVPAGMALIGGGASGPIGIDEMSGLTGDPDSAKKSLEADGFTAAYTAQYVDESSGALITATVARFSRPAGARAHYARDVTEAKVEAEQVPVAGLGDQGSSSLFTVTEGDVDEVFALRFRRGDTWWVVSTAARGKADQQLARRLAGTVLRRAQG